MKFLSILALFFFLLISCGPTPEEIAKGKFDRANQLFSQKLFNDAMLVLDSIVEEFPNEIEYVTRAKDLIRTIKIGEQKRNLVYLDSAITIKQNELDILMRNFIVTKEYGEKEVLIHKRQKPQNSYDRTYLRAHLDIEGNFYISSRYTGDKYIHHNQIKVYHKSQAVTSEQISQDGFDNRQFEDGGNYWEVVNYKNNADNGIIDFISQNTHLPLKVHFVGKGHYYILMEKFDKEAIRDGYEISFVLKEIAKLKSDIKNVNDQLKSLQ
jgi:hypothetical protein